MDDQLAAGDPGTDQPAASSTKEDALYYRRSSLISKVTQSIIALAVTLTTLACAAVLVVQGAKDGSPFSLLSNTFFLVVGFYFGQTIPNGRGGSSKG